MLDFTETFKKIGRELVRGLRNHMIRQKGLDGSAYSRPELATLKARQRGLTKTNKAGRARKGSLGSVPITRMYVTQRTAKDSFQFDAAKDSLRLYVSKDKHPNGERYTDLIAYNSRDSGNTNPDIKNPPLIFPVKPEDLEGMKSEMTMARRIFTHDAKRIVEEQLKFRMKLELRIG